MAMTGKERYAMRKATFFGTGTWSDREGNL